MSPGAKRRPPDARPSIGRSCEVCQFWQKRQRKLHPAAAIEKAVDPGKKWKNGFFLDGIGPGAHHLAVRPGDEPAGPVFPDSANAEMAGMNLTAVGAKAQRTALSPANRPEARLMDAG